VLLSESFEDSAGYLADIYLTKVGVCFSYYADVVLLYRGNLSYSSDICFIKENTATYYIDCDIYGKTIHYNVEATVLNALDFSYSADVGVTEYFPDGLTGESYSEVI
jgi:hypothetical protein